MLRKSLTRAAVVAATVISGFTALTLLAAPAFAGASEEGIDAGKSLGVGLWILIFLGIPVSVFVVIACLVYGPGLLRRPRYRPGYQDWGYRPLWVGGPPDPDTALTSTPTDAVIDIRGGGAGAGW